MVPGFVAGIARFAGPELTPNRTVRRGLWRRGHSGGEPSGSEKLRIFETGSFPCVAAVTARFALPGLALNRTVRRVLWRRGHSSRESRGLKTADSHDPRMVPGFATGIARFAARGFARNRTRRGKPACLRRPSFARRSGLGEGGSQAALILRRRRTAWRRPAGCAARLRCRSVGGAMVRQGRTPGEADRAARRGPDSSPNRSSRFLARPS